MQPDATRNAGRTEATVPGPAPKPAHQRRRRNAPMANTVQLPVEGRTDPAPDWPLAVDVAPAWHDLWSLPQAVAWERLGWHRTVARYAHVLTLVETAEPSAALLAQATALEDRLGLTPMSMLRLRWEVVTDALAEVRETASPAAKPRRTLKVVPDAVAGS